MSVTVRFLLYWWVAYLSGAVAIITMLSSNAACVGVCLWTLGVIFAWCWYEWCPICTGRVAVDEHTCCNATIRRELDEHYHKVLEHPREWSSLKVTQARDYVTRHERD